MNAKIDVLEIGAVRFLTTHRTLGFVARTLGQSLLKSPSEGGLSIAASCEPTDIWVGAHRTRRLPRTPGRRLVVIQTEQILDAGSGRRIYDKIRWTRMARLALQADLFVEWNPHNRAFYGVLPRLLPRRFLFGPHVFPVQPCSRTPGEGLVFVGAVNADRAQKLSGLPGTRMPPRDAGIEEIDRVIAAGDAMLNLHSLPGVYTEVPRVLMACLAGKPLVSEALAAPFEAGQSYLLPEAERTPESLAQAWAGLQAVAARYPITRML